MPRLAVKLIFLSGDSEDEIFEFKPDAKAVGFMVLGPWRFGQKKNSPAEWLIFPHFWQGVLDQVEQTIFFRIFFLGSTQADTKFGSQCGPPWIVKIHLFLNNQIGLLTLDFCLISTRIESPAPQTNPRMFKSSLRRVFHPVQGRSDIKLM